MVTASTGVPEGAWIAVQVHCGWERVIATSLRHRGYEEFLPEYRTRRSGMHPRAPRNRALFPGYVFCRYVRTPHYRIVETPGVLRLVGTGKVPAEIPESEVEGIRRLVDSGLPSQPWRYLQIGDRARIDGGPLRGLEGILISIRNSMRFVISVPLLQRSVVVEVDASDVIVVRSQTA